MSDHLHTDLLRGTKLAPKGELPDAAFEDPEEILKARSLVFSESNTEGKLFLGLIGAEVHKETLPNGRIVRHATGGHAVGYGDDKGSGSGSEPKTIDRRNLMTDTQPNPPTHRAKIARGYGGTRTYETIGAAWINHEDGSVFVKLTGKQIVEDGFNLYPIEAKAEDSA